jgi:UDP-N-acetylmuramoylalanine--D-glutamate ligase
VTAPAGPLVAEWQESGGEVAVVGFGKSGVAATRLLRARGVAVYASDSAASERYAAWAAELRAIGAAVEVGGHDLSRIGRAVAVVVAPGVPPDVPPLAAARNAGVPIFAEVDLGFTEVPRTRAVAITGTNGKTTTTSLVAHLMDAAGIRGRAAGNIGLPLCDLALAGNHPDWVALELSSFQLHDAPHIRPAIGVLTNLAPNHLDRYATLEEYYGDKALLFRHADDRSVWITNADDPAVVEMVSGVTGRHLRFSVENRADGWLDAASGTLMLASEPLMPRGDLPLLGVHNVANALAAALVLREIGARPSDIAAGLRTFQAIPHRVEPVREIDGVLWINDSKSTNVTSTAVAIAALDRPFVLLLGGRHKGEPYSRLASQLAGRGRAAVAYGEAGPIVERDLGGQLPVTPAGEFDDVIAAARRLAEPGDAVLLSPACSSYDMFRNYEERGARFRALVEAM